MSRPSFTASLREVTVTFADRTVLDRVDVTVGQQDRIAVIGDNGSGKSTLLGVLAGTVPSPPENGRQICPAASPSRNSIPSFPMTPLSTGQSTSS